MSHHDHAGAGRSTPAPAVEPGGELTTLPERQDELELAHDIPESELRPESDDLSISGLGLALRLQDAVGTWREGDTTALEEVGHADKGDVSEPEPESFVPLTDSGGQGL